MAHLAALEQARAGLQRNPSESTGTIRRVARAVRGMALEAGLVELAEVADSTRSAGGADIPEATRALIQRLRAALRGGTRDVALVVVAEPDPAHAAQCRSALVGAGRKVVRVSTARELRELVDTEPVQLVVMALELPDEDGRSVLLDLRQRARTARLPVMIVASDDTSLAVTECYALGADKVVVRPVAPFALSAAVASSLARHQAMERRVLRDALTTLPNREALIERFAGAVANAQRSRLPLSVAVMGFDHLDAVNDRHGHGVGDQVVRDGARLMRGVLREGDVLGRWSDAQFVALMLGSDASTAALAVERALDVMRRQRFEVADRSQLRVTLSAGVTRADPRASLHDATRAALALLRQAKQAGGDRVVSPDASQTNVRRAVMVASAEEAESRAFATALAAQGCVPHVAPSAVEALRFAAGGGLSAIVVDQALPDADGLDLVVRLRRDAATRSLPIVLMTTKHREGALARAFDKGADESIMKPIQPDDLATRVKHLLKIR